MGFQRARAGKAPDCPWCGGTMIPCPELKGRLCCPNDEAVDYRARGERWYFNGQIHPLGEPFPPGPDEEDEGGFGFDDEATSESDEATLESRVETHREPESNDTAKTQESGELPEPRDSPEPPEPPGDQGGLNPDVIADIESLLEEDESDGSDGGGSW